MKYLLWHNKKITSLLVAFSIETVLEVGKTAMNLLKFDSYYRHMLLFTTI